MQKLRLPYQGSKNLIAVSLIEEIQKYKPNAKYFIDLFGGGGSMSFTALQLGYKVLYNDYDTNLVNFIKYVFDRIKSGIRSEYGLFPSDWYNFVDKKLFMEQLNKNTPYAEFVKICYSFGNGRKGYLFGADIVEYKENFHNFLIFNDNKSKEFLKNKFKDSYYWLFDETPMMDWRKEGLCL